MSTLSGCSKSTGRIETKLTIGNETNSVVLHVFEHFSHEILIGAPDAGLFNLVADLRTKTLKQIAKGSVEVVNTQESEEKRKEVGELDDHRIFARDRNDIGRINGAAHHIRIPPGTVPISVTPYRQSSATNELIRKLVSEMLAAGVVRPSVSPWAFPVTIAKKKDGSPRFCVDYRRLNAVTIDEHTPLPHIDDLLNRVANARVF